MTEGRLTRIGVALLSLLLGLAWLLPNHYLPWPAFHTDSWIATVLLLVLWLQLLAGPRDLRMSGLPGVLLLVACIPMAHVAVGLLEMPGDAWVSLAYLFGFALAVAFGELWAKQASGAPASFLFLPVVIAGLVSVGLQVDQWTGGTEGDAPTDIWVMYLPPGMRPFANLGQPNQLATLLLWGVIGLLWGWHRGVLRGWMVLCAGCVLVLGLALTQSRTGWLSFFVLVALACIWRKREFGRQILWVLGGLYGLYLALLVTLPFIAELLQLSSAGSMAERLRSGLSAEVRLQAWAMFFQSSLERPWLGYGWGHTREAMMAMMPLYPQLAGQQFGHAHMLPLDLILWVGWPLGLLLIGVISWWLVIQARSVRSADHALIYAAVLVMGIHAMLELPLHYAYFLLPTGMLIGALNVHASARLRWFTVRIGWLVIPSLFATILLAAIIRDYFHVERAFVALRMERQRVGTDFDREPPDAWVLRQWHAFMVMAREEPRRGMSADQLAQWKALVLYYPAASAVEKYMRALQLNDLHSDLVDFRDRLCAIMDAHTCKLMQTRWAKAMQQTGPGQMKPSASTAAVMSAPTSESRSLSSVR